MSLSTLTVATTANIHQTAVLPTTATAAIDNKNTVFITDDKQQRAVTSPSPAHAPAHATIDHKHSADDPAPAGVDEQIFRAIHCMQCSLPLMMPVLDSDVSLLQQNGAILKQGQWIVRGKAAMRKCMKWMTPQQQREFVMLEHQWTPRQLMEMKKNKEKTKNKKTK